MNRRGDQYGHVRVSKRPKGEKPYYGRVRFLGKEIYTQRYATADQAALAREILEAALQLVGTVSIPSHDRGTP